MGFCVCCAHCTPLFLQSFPTRNVTTEGMRVAYTETVMRCGGGAHSYYLNFSVPGTATVTVSASDQE